MVTKKLKHCDVGNHDVPVLFHARKIDRPSCCANCYRSPGLSETEMAQKLGIEIMKLASKYLKAYRSGLMTEIKKVSKNQTKRLALYRKVMDEYMAEHPICEFPFCVNKSTDLHHGAGRIGNLLTDKRYFKALCRPHHVTVETYPDNAKELGLSFSRLGK
jgi:hypothetical protein